MLFPESNNKRKNRRVVITGAGIITGHGNGWHDNAEGFRSGNVALRPVTLFDTSRQRVSIAAEVRLPESAPDTLLPIKQVRRLDRAGIMLLHAVHQAYAQSQWNAHEDTPVIMGTTSGGMALGEVYFRHATRSPAKHRGQPTRAYIYQAQTQVRLAAEAVGCYGPITIISNACASGANALGLAWEWVHGGRADRVLTGGYDALSELVFTGFNSLQSLSPTGCRPFDAARDGLSIGEGAAAFTLETLDSAEARGAPILGEITGYAACIDTHHLTQPHPEGDAAVFTMTRACRSAGVAPEDIDYVNAHGTGTPANDGSEAIALRRWAGRHVSSLNVSSTKAGIGHLLGAAGAVEAAACLMAVQGQWLPPETSINEPDPLCEFNIIRRPMGSKIEYALSNSFGFGGANATLILRRWS
ncbi:MAG: beta-ketoacyl-[acyl-carrier-protein] synthase family protein [Verrucomicrobia bacterium]|nr:beta-ketoacyl-[acyl-carrier-protein] synthase family protein [Verrucomicrobiota bacterium]